MRVLFLATGLLCLAACASDGGGGGASGADAPGPSAAQDAGLSGGEGGGRYCDGANLCPDGYTCFRNECIYQGAARDAGVVADAGQEGPEEALTFTPPAAGAEYVWVASPETDSVVRIHAQTLLVEPIELGDEPTVVRTVPGEDVAVVLNRGSDEVAVVSGDDIDFYRLPHHANALDLDPSGRYAFAWFNIHDVRPGEDISAMQDLTVIDLGNSTVHRVTVGFRPERIVFVAGGQTALVVNEDGLSMVVPEGLPERSIAPLVPTARDVFHTVDREVHVAPDGSVAVSRGPGETGVTVVRLDVDPLLATPWFVELGAEPTDIDLLPGADEALVMLRSLERLAFVPLGEPVVGEAPEITEVPFTGYLLGTAALGVGPVAVLYTTADVPDGPPPIALLDLESGVMVFRPVRKPLRAAALSPDGRTAFLLHQRAPGAPASQSPDVVLEHSEAFTMLSLETGFQKLQTTTNAARGLLFTDDRDEAFVLVGAPGSGVAELLRLELDGFEVTRYTLGSTPEVVGLLSDIDQAFVTQTHPTGRVSFLNLTEDTARIRTVSGYALNGRIE